MSARTEPEPSVALPAFFATAAANVLVLGFATAVLRIALGRELLKFGVESPDRLWLMGSSLFYVLFAFAAETALAGALGAFAAKRLLGKATSRES
jgi:hypothetical protein